MIADKAHSDNSKKVARLLAERILSQNRAQLLQIRLRARLHPAQLEIAQDKTRFRVVACGRRFGKTELGMIEVAERALMGKWCWWLAPTHDQGEEVWQQVKLLLQRFSKAEYINNSKRLIRMEGGGGVQVKTASKPDNLRGKGLDFVVFDEAAFIAPSVWKSVVRPMLATTTGGALFISSPRGRNWFWEVYTDGLNPLETEWSSHHYTSWQTPLISESERQSIERKTPERELREEYYAEFLDDMGIVFRRIKDAAKVEAGETPIADHRYVFGVDWGRDNDYTVIACVDTSTTPARLVATDRFREIGWDIQRARLANMADIWKPKSIWAEANSIGSVNIEALQNEGLPVVGFTTTHQSKAPLIEGFAMAIERGELQLLKDEYFLGELAAYTMSRLPGGGYRYSAPSGMHDDMVIAAALAWHGAISNHALIKTTRHNPFFR